MIHTSAGISAKVLLVPFGGFDKCRVWPGIGLIQKAREAVAVPVPEDRHVPLLDNGSGLPNEGADGEVADGLSQRRSSLLDDLLEISRQAEVDPGISGFGSYNSPRWVKQSCTSNSPTNNSTWV